MPYLGYSFFGYSPSYSISISCSDGRSWVGLPALVDSTSPRYATSYQWQIRSTTTGSQGTLGSEAGRSCTATTFAPAGRTITVAPFDNDWSSDGVPGQVWRNYLGQYVTQVGPGAGGGL